ncbi:MAG: hypothetical protein ACK481_01635 [Candidatus Melainabacteria bacterium]|jgi:hypothetical protein
MQSASSVVRSNTATNTNSSLTNSIVLNADRDKKNIFQKAWDVYFAICEFAVLKLAKFFSLNSIKTEFFDKDSQKYIEFYKSILLEGNGGWEACHISSALNSVRVGLVQDGKPIPQYMENNEKSIKWAMSFLRNNKEFPQFKDLDDNCQWKDKAANGYVSIITAGLVFDRFFKNHSEFLLSDALPDNQNKKVNLKSLIALINDLSTGKMGVFSFAPAVFPFPDGHSVSLLNYFPPSEGVQNTLKVLSKMKERYGDSSNSSAIVDQLPNLGDILIYDQSTNSFHRWNINEFIKKKHFTIAIIADSLVGKGSNSKELTEAITIAMKQRNEEAHKKDKS